MEVTKFILPNKKIRQYPIDNVVAVYIGGYSSEEKRPIECLEKIWEELGGEKPGQNLRQELSVPHLHYGFCPLARKEDMPFRDGCKMYYRTINGDKKLGKYYRLIFFGKDNCRRLQECTKRLGKLLGIYPSEEMLDSRRRISALVFTELAFEKVSKML